MAREKSPEFEVEEVKVENTTCKCTQESIGTCHY